MEQIDRILVDINMLHICQCGSFAYGGLCWDCFQYGQHLGLTLRWWQQ